MRIPDAADRKRGYDAMCELTERLAGVVSRVKQLMAVARHERRDITVDELQAAINPAVRMDAGSHDQSGGA